MQGLEFLKNLPEGVSVTCNPLKKIKTISRASSLPDPQLMSVSRVDKQLCMHVLLHKNHHCLSWAVATAPVWGKTQKTKPTYKKKGIAGPHIVSHGGTATTGGGGGSVSTTDDQWQ